MRHLIAIAVLLGTAASAEVRVATMSFSTRGIPPELGAVYAERFATALRRRGISVTTEKDLASILSVERQRQLLGCAESSATCLTELAGALGAPFVVTGNVSRIGSGVTLSIKVLKVDESATVFSKSEELPSVEKVLDALEAAAPEAAERLLALSSPAGDAAAPGLSRSAQTAPSATGPWLVIALGAVGAGVGVGLLISAQLFAAPLYQDPQPDFGPAAATALAEKTTTLRLAGAVTAGVGAALLAGGVAWRLLQGSGPALALVPTSGGAALAFGAAF